jgi:hypothetical protein
MSVSYKLASTGLISCFWHNKFSVYSHRHVYSSLILVSKARDFSYSVKYALKGTSTYNRAFGSARHGIYSYMHH